MCLGVGIVRVGSAEVCIDGSWTEVWGVCHNISTLRKLIRIL